MAVVKGKKTEEVIPYAGSRRVQAEGADRNGRGRNAQERVYQPGDVYLENDRRERKASGSYYTPDHIVKHIVENTVGPVLDREVRQAAPKAPRGPGGLPAGRRQCRQLSGGKGMQARRPSQGRQQSTRALWTTSST